MVGVLELSWVCCRLVGFGRVASKVTCLPVKPDRVQKYLSGMHYQYTLLYPESVSGPGGSTTPCLCQCPSTVSVPIVVRACVRCRRRPCPLLPSPSCCGRCCHRHLHRGCCCRCRRRRKVRGIDGSEQIQHRTNRYKVRLCRKMNMEQIETKLDGFDFHACHAYQT